MIIEITNFDAPELDVYARLSERQLLHYNEPAQGLFIAESPNVIATALDAGYVPVSVLAERKYIEKDEKNIIGRCPDIPVFSCELDVLNQLSGFGVTRGMLCAMKRPALPAADRICKDASRIVVLEDVMNPTNVGAIFRSAAALNMDAVLLTDGCADPLYRRAVRVSMGTVFQIPWTFGVTVEYLHSQGFKTAAMALNENALSIDDPRLREEKRLAIVLGTEGDGLKEKTIADCDYTVRIPMAHGVDSLNVAAASAVAFWQLGQHK